MTSGTGAAPYGDTTTTALLLTNRGGNSLRLRVPWSALRPLTPRTAWVRTVWGGREGPPPLLAAWGGRDGVGAHALRAATLEALDLPPHACALLLLFTSREAAVAFPQLPPPAAASNARAAVSRLASSAAAAASGAPAAAMSARPSPVALHLLLVALAV